MKKTLMTFLLGIMAAGVSAQMTFTLNGVTYGDVAERDSKGCLFLKMVDSFLSFY